MKYLIPISIILIGVLGCSGSNLINPDIEGSNASPNLATLTTNQWTWGNYIFHVSADRSTVDILQNRMAGYHLNVTPFVEGPPCSDCLWVGKVHPMPDGTIKLYINLRHPFYGHPIYTGFDVRGVCLFKASDYLVDQYSNVMSTDEYPVTYYKIPLNYSDPLKGGAALLNLDGYTFCLNPFIKMKWAEPPLNKLLPIFNYSKAKHAYGDVDTTVNPYILFADKSPRRMFKHNDLFTRTYHIKPPEGSGPFEFGYVVSACWAPPIKTPVTNPEVDFPITANCEDAYEISIVQLTPCTQEKYNTYEPIFKAIIKHRIDQKPELGARIFSSTLLKSNDPGLEDDNLTCFFCSYFGPGHPSYNPDDVKEINDETTELIFRANEDMVYECHSLVPGWHLGILTLQGQKQSPAPGAQFLFPFSVHPVMMYVQE